MKIRKDIELKRLENYGYHYEENLFYPVYQKRIGYGNGIVLIEVLLKDRTIFINKNKAITKKNIHFIHDLVKNDFVEK